MTRTATHTETGRTLVIFEERTNIADNGDFYTQYAIAFEGTHFAARGMANGWMNADKVELH